MVQPNSKEFWIQMKRANAPEVTSQELAWMPSTKHRSQYKDNCFLHTIPKIWGGAQSRLAPGIPL